MAVLTIDFHNTLVECDEWFELEVRTLVSSALAWIEEHTDHRFPQVDPLQADAVYRKLRLAIHHHGHEVDAYRSLALVLERLGAVVPHHVIRDAVDARMRESLAYASPVAGAGELLRAVREQGIRIGIVSSAVHHDFLEWALERFSMREHIDTVTTSASAGFYKSRPEIYWTAMAAMKHVPSRGLHLGDSLRFDVGGAQRAGMQSVWFDRKGEGINGNEHFRPVLVVTDLRDASDHVFAVLDSLDSDTQ